MSKRSCRVFILTVVLGILLFADCSFNNPFYQYDFSQTVITTSSTTTTTTYVSNSTTTTVAPTTTTYASTTTTTTYVSNSTTTSSTTTTTTTIDTEKPTILVFSRTSDASSDSSIITFNLSGTDNVGITGWFISKSSTTPSINDAGWLADKPANFDIGSGSAAGVYTVYIWAKDAAGNISGAKSISFEYYIVSLAGYVKDSAGNAIYGALIRLYNNNYSFLTSSGIAGYYEFHNIPSGNYYLIAVRDGYTLETKIVVIP
ncbi:MAG TPA: carboxypeptidase-like regulatory domain-containing protein [Spirochaetota bacterium]|nr:carboxypeptidase-like regulatory domain-containing protein [Spirochaetota bacterium]HOS34104.1 carboxypeptidase-like regulatory domain-containing protein [Spirochaetota bacterium]HOS56832.1 carboxypeptidase-like regulatory domain-containing protein [Spirochaetota bacterium]HQF78531.1 carboxypeptidase-like regulatory domain-containing protein [Spirochaetota bacterium]HQH31752.1 carboxypeptidase-like regulatory domain-containing protein [Spirochaetota bacterium]